MVVRSRLRLSAHKKQLGAVYSIHVSAILHRGKFVDVKRVKISSLAASQVPISKNSKVMCFSLKRLKRILEKTYF